MRRGVSISVVIGVVFLVGACMLWLTIGGSGSDQSDKIHVGELYSVVRGGFDVSVPTSGELAAENQINIHNMLESDAVIIELVDEATLVQKDDVLLRLNDEAIKTAIEDAEFNVTSAINNVETSTANLAIAQKQRDSELAVKQLSVDLADLALRAWAEGEVIATRQQLQLAVQTAEKNYERMLKKHESSLGLYEKQFLSKDELDQDEIALLNADATLKKARLDVVVYENYTHKQNQQKKESDLRQARDELDRAKDRLASELNSLRATLEARENHLAKRKEQLDKRNMQLELCVVRSPASGMVVYATSMGRERDEGEPLKVGKSLWRNQLVMIIPDTSNMVARVKVNEALSGLVSRGQRAIIACDAFPDLAFVGEVNSVGVLAIGGGWRDPSRRDYTVEIRLENPDQLALKPSMRCSAEIFVERVEDVLFVPIHAIHRDGGVVWVWVRESGGFSQRVVTPDRFSESFVGISSGLDEGDAVLLREPAPSQVVKRLSTEQTE